MLKENEININNCRKNDYDELFSEASGSAFLSSVTGGESESFVRTFYRIMKRAKLKNDEVDFVMLRKVNGIRELPIQIGDYKLRIAVVEGLNNFEKLLINDKYKHYHYIEVVNCKGGCAYGSGRLISIKEEEKNETFYEIDRNMSKRCSHDNKDIKELYSKFLEKPLSTKCLEILHQSYIDQSNLLNDK